MDVKQSYFDYLAEHGAKEKIKDIIAKGIEEWKGRQAYEWEDSVNDFGDVSGELHQVFRNGKPTTIGEVCNTDMDVLLSYSGHSEATYCNGCGLRYPNVAQEISWDINTYLGKLESEWILRHRDDLMHNQPENYIEDEWTDKDILEYVEEHILADERLNHEWMAREFREYTYQEEGTSIPPELLFDIDG